MMWWNDGMSAGGWVAMTLVMVVFWALLILGLMAIIRETGDARPLARPRDRDPLEILDERYARGEIDAEEYQVRQAALSARH